MLDKIHQLQAEMTQPPAHGRHAIEALQRAIINDLDPYEPETRHYFAGGMYCREVFRVAGSIVVGAVHKSEHFYIVSKGSVAIWDGEGEPVHHDAPSILISQPGSKKSVFALTDAVCMTVHRTNANTVEEAELELVEQDPNSMYTTGNKLKNPLIEEYEK